ncbi:MAG: sensor histidine kinase [Lachnospiraceae bacterium]|nr:sensor histidine kinase [Lachnospiraceae bacterium]
MFEKLKGKPSAKILFFVLSVLSITFSIVEFCNILLKSMLLEYGSGDLYRELHVDYIEDYVRGIENMSDICIYLGLVVGIICSIFFFIGYMTISGYYVVDKEIQIQRRGLSKIPLDLNFGIFMVLEGLAMSLLAELSYVLEMGSNMAGIIVLMICLIAVAMVAVALLYVMTLAVNFKMPKWWMHTICYKIIDFILGIVRNVSDNIRCNMGRIKLQRRIWMIVGAVSFAEFILIVTCLDYDAYGFLILLWLFEKIILIVFVYRLINQYAQIKDATQRISEGDLEAEVNTEKMYIDLKEEGDCLNSIKNGLDAAIEQRMKSERFQTELITNVSHDIKTPLTSIINYVDLLGKEKLENAKAKEYLEVLTRQSQRLKKLLQDLLDASKASTGNVELHMEQVNACVLLNQTVGEFQEKLMNSGIELNIKLPQEEIQINADSRYLWRVFDNLMNNICKYSQPNTRAYINLEKTNNNTVISFLNISKEPLNISSEELMQRFVRGDSSRNTEGSGLGLSIAKSLTKLMGGTMELSVEGDLFKVQLIF